MSKKQKKNFVKYALSMIDQIQQYADPNMDFKASLELDEVDVTRPGDAYSYSLIGTGRKLTLEWHEKKNLVKVNKN